MITKSGRDLAKEAARIPKALRIPKATFDQIASFTMARASDSRKRAMGKAVLRGMLQGLVAGGMVGGGVKGVRMVKEINEKGKGA